MVGSCCCSAVACLPSFCRPKLVESRTRRRLDDAAPLVVESRTHRQRSRSPRGTPQVRRERERESRGRRGSHQARTAGPAVEKGISVFAASASGKRAPPLHSKLCGRPPHHLFLNLPSLGRRQRNLHTNSGAANPSPSQPRAAATHQGPRRFMLPTTRRRLVAVGQLLGHDLRSRGGGGTAGHRAAT
jgi:hypothetical protein